MSKSPHQLRVNKFMKLANQIIPSSPIMPLSEVRLLRAKLIMEEAFELVRALGIHVNDSDCERDDIDFKNLSFHADGIFNMLEVIDGCCDLKVVTTGTLSACGLEDEKFQKIVDEDNLLKLGPGSYLREDGKL